MNITLYLVHWVFKFPKAICINYYDESSYTKVEVTTNEKTAGGHIIPEVLGYSHMCTMNLKHFSLTK